MTLTVSFPQTDIPMCKNYMNGWLNTLVIRDMKLKPYEIPFYTDQSC